MKKVQLTAKQVQKQLGVEYVLANNLLRLLESKGTAKHVETVKASGGKGRGKKVYELPQKVTLDFSEVEAEAA